MVGFENYFQKERNIDRQTDRQTAEAQKERMMAATVGHSETCFQSLASSPHRQIVDSDYDCDYRSVFIRGEPLHGYVHVPVRNNHHVVSEQGRKIWFGRGS